MYNNSFALKSSVRILVLGATVQDEAKQSKEGGGTKMQPNVEVLPTTT